MERIFISVISMDAEDVTVVVIQIFRSSGSFRKGFVCERGCFFIIINYTIFCFAPDISRVHLDWDFKCGSNSFRWSAPLLFRGPPQYVRPPA